MENELPFERRQLTRRRFVLMSAGALVLASCGGKSGDEATGGAAAGETASAAAKTYDGPPVELQFWNGFTGGDGPFMRDLVKKFNGETPNVNVKMVVQQWGDFYTKVPTAVASGRGPDVAIMHLDQLGTNAARNVIVPLDDLAETLELDSSDYAKVVWDAGIYNDKRYGIPLDTHPLGFYYNTAHLEKAGIDKPPQTRDEHDEALKKLKAAGFEQPFWQSSTWPAHLMFTSLIEQFGGSLINEDASEATFADEPGVEALTWMVSLVKDGYSPKNVASDADYIAFKNQKTSLHWDGIWQTQDLAKTNVPWDVAPLPQIGSEKGAWAGSHNFVLTKQGEKDENKQQAAKTFIIWVSERSLEWAKAGQIPARNSVRNSAGFKQLEHQSTLAQQQGYVTFWPAVPGISDTIAEVEQAVNRAVLLKQAPEQSLRQGAGKADKLLEENKKKYGTS